MVEATNTNSNAAGAQTGNPPRAPGGPSGPPYKIGVADKMGNEIGPDANGFSKPEDKEARSLVFDIQLENAPTTADMGFERDLGKIEFALCKLYPDTDAAAEAKFRPYFVRLFYLSQLILEGDIRKDANGKKVVGEKRLSSEAAKVDIEALGADLIDDEAPRVKNDRLRDLIRWAGGLGAAFLAAYFVLALGASNTAFFDFLKILNVEAHYAANFMLLWVGALIGVCLSYAFRTHQFSLIDLTRDDSSYLAPQYRLLLTGALAMLLAMFAVVGLGDVEFGGIKLSAIATKSELAFVIGAILGISEKTLSGTVEKRAGALFGGTSK